MFPLKKNQNSCGSVAWDVRENTAFRNDDLGDSLVGHWLGETGAQYLAGELRSWKLWGVAKKKKKKQQFYASVSLYFIMKVLGFFSLDFSVFRVIYRLSLCNIIEEYETSCAYSYKLNYLQRKQLNYLQCVWVSSSLPI